MDLQQAFAECAMTVRERDPDRYFSALFAPAGQRRFLFALYAFNRELAHVGETVREPMLGEIRLAWWRETLDGARRNAPRPASCGPRSGRDACRNPSCRRNCSTR